MTKLLTGQSTRCTGSREVILTNVLPMHVRNAKRHCTLSASRYTMDSRKGDKGWKRQKKNRKVDKGWGEAVQRKKRKVDKKDNQNDWSVFGKEGQLIQDRLYDSRSDWSQFKIVMHKLILRLVLKPTSDIYIYIYIYLNAYSTGYLYAKYSVYVQYYLNVKREGITRLLYSC